MGLLVTPTSDTLLRYFNMFHQAPSLSSLLVEIKNEVNVSQKRVKTRIYFHEAIIRSTMTNLCTNHCSDDYKPIEFREEGYH
jgi:hypothetical protein